uniref:Uncharacterized protein n=1 Tax=Kwoniella bestiolae CBS 10118 TaxID=1296100 RepID=A0A1B9GBS8_9TREE|nr:hypothetical protein I302_03328 [Kwoniella bestiolae CBS 10118]OCF28469.1 hypothetical protein I302_03328 [Kwoniella bestiolae CBS 10118]
MPATSERDTPIRRILLRDDEGLEYLLTVDTKTNEITHGIVHPEVIPRKSFRAAGSTSALSVGIP